MDLVIISKVPYVVEESTNSGYEYTSRSSTVTVLQIKDRERRDHVFSKPHFKI